MDTEYLVLVNEEDQEQGQAEKWEVHKKGLLHRAFSILVFNSNNEILLHKRANGKYHSGGLWTNTCCGHPRPGEGLIEAANRRLMEEMGFETSLHEVFSFIYKSQVTEELTEYEYDHVFFGRYDNAPVLNIQEASEWKYMSIESVKKDAIQNPDNYSVWFKIILEKIDPYLVKIPYLGVKTISRQFRYKKPQEYQLSSASSSLYNSKICAAVKAKLRQREGSASKPACLDFGAVKYYLASHFGFCLGVANAIDIAYEAIATYPEKKVYMLSELIHNSFVNEDLKR
ncbi:MAG TPA: isopentenyl-diphosphate Delta-isomerase, partial [Cytophagaceae bacterium]